MENRVIGQITKALAEVKEIEPSTLDIVLERHVSADAIRELVTHKSNSWKLQFNTPDHVVEISGNDVVFIDGEHQGTLGDW